MSATHARKISPRTWIVVGIVGLILLVAFAFVREYVRNIDIATELERMQSENASLNARHLASLDLISQLSTETTVEGEARAKLNLAKPGETMYVVQDDAPSSPSDSPDESSSFVSLAQDPSLSNSAKWFYYFFAPDVSSDPSAL